MAIFWTDIPDLSPRDGACLPAWQRSWRQPEHLLADAEDRTNSIRLDGATEHCPVWVGRRCEGNWAVYVRVGTFRIKPGTLDEFRQRYYAECAPLVKSARGSVDCMVLEPVDHETPLAVCTVWETEDDATAYEASGAAAEVVGRVREFFAGPPQLCSYRIRRP